MSESKIRAKSEIKIISGNGNLSLTYTYPKGHSLQKIIDDLQAIVDVDKGIEEPPKENESE